MWQAGGSRDERVRCTFAIQPLGASASGDAISEGRSSCLVAAEHRSCPDLWRGGFAPGTVPPVPESENGIQKPYSTFPGPRAPSPRITRHPAGTGAREEIPDPRRLRPLEIDQRASLGQQRRMDRVHDLPRGRGRGHDPPVHRRPESPDRRDQRASGPRITPDSRFLIFNIDPMQAVVDSLEEADTDRDEMPTDSLGDHRSLVGVRVGRIHQHRLLQG